MITNDCQFWFEGMDRHQMADLIDEEFPISLRSFDERILTRVCNRYPYIDKADTIRIVKSFFKVIRRLMILGYRLHIDELVRAMRLHFYLNQGNPDQPVVKVATRRTRPVIRGLFNDDTR